MSLLMYTLCNCLILITLYRALRSFHKHRFGKPHARKFIIKRVIVPHQRDNVNCGYYVCRFMKTIIGRGWRSTDIQKTGAAKNVLIIH